MPSVSDDLFERVMNLTASDKKRLISKLGKQLLDARKHDRLTVSKTRSDRLVLIKEPLENVLAELTEEEALAKWPWFREWQQRALAGEGELILSGEI